MSDADYTLAHRVDGSRHHARILANQTSYAITFYAIHIHANDDGRLVESTRRVSLDDAKRAAAMLLQGADARAAEGRP